ncbi:MAG TPA: FAD-dependent oxidoreductase [Vicinamibacterales bacterium]|nr:FAD-dependent oxidoreductase [Vicinamibacterales bacterium]HPK71561.1 FAD-dependent oxidoreductase [Vicinamibacterales bacterium]
MRRDFSRLAGRPFDVLIVGGGIHGLAAAYDAAQRGFSTALVERADFGSGSSFNHAKTVHGGLRSLQTGDVRKARFSICERRAMARIAPHLVTPLAFAMATTRKLTRSTWALRAGFLADAAIGYDRNAAVPPGLRLPAGRVIGLQEYRRAFGADAQPEATGAATWWDYQMPFSDRLTFAFAQAAAASGAVLVNYAEALEPLMTGRRVRGARVCDGLDGGVVEVEARVTVNAAGAACRPWMERLGGSPSFPLLKAMNLVTSRPAGPLALSAPTSGGRLLLIMPWQGRMLIGTSHSDRPAEPGDLAVGCAEVSAFVAEVNSAFPALRLRQDEVTLVHRGVVPAVRDRRGALGLMGHHRVHDHEADGVSGAVSMIGVKYTTGRGVAEQAVGLLAGKLGRSGPPCRTGITRLPGADLDSLEAETARAASETRGLFGSDSLAAVVATHGTRWRQVAALCRADPSLAEPIGGGVPFPQAAVVHAVRDEMACTLADVVLRRLPIGAAARPDPAAVSACAALMAAECGWGPDRVASEIQALDSFYAIE